MPMTRGMESACYVKMAPGVTAADLRQKLVVSRAPGALTRRGGEAAQGGGFCLVPGPPRLHSSWVPVGIAVQVC